MNKLIALLVAGLMGGCLVAVPEEPAPEEDADAWGAELIEEAPACPAERMCLGVCCPVDLYETAATLEDDSGRGLVAQGPFAWCNLPEPLACPVPR